ncbi:hypothetical protein AJ80_02745 [Polytolypa hystricis UAMH7299]|uniref:Peptidase S9 prolyl oligopeptidase catalytic domain-containing protein n=1 Tax=Polytolypa hystricis (strain UAMH7299) TaxID=1447883 RepID=A0A2B7YR60_POLH7|nr:hypothetical protein AJ80_02745 [Polytolypa hystricis UAMH7299]
MWLLSSVYFAFINVSLWLSWMHHGDETKTHAPVENMRPSLCPELHNSDESYLTLSRTWHVLGPFKSGTREATWGADHLERLGGFRNLSYDLGARFNSALGPDGYVRWSSIQVEEPVSGAGYAKATINLSFPEVDWAFLRSIYGWSALQYQAWARGNLTVIGTVPVTVGLFTDGVLEFRVDDEPYFGGDFYAYRRAPLIVSLAPGNHVLDIRLVRDVRALGGPEQPTIKARIEIIEALGEVGIDNSTLLTAEVVEGRLLSPFASITFRNHLRSWVEIREIQSFGPSETHLSLLDGPLRLAPYQSRPIAFTVKSHGSSSLNFSFNFGYGVDYSTETRISQTVDVNLTEREINEAQKVTFLHPSGIVSYAILRPPVNSSCHSEVNGKLPVLIGLHGAGLEADSELARHMLDAAYGICTWFIFPTGVTPWSGDDWHTWGSADVLAAVAAIPNWIKAVGWNGPGVALEDWLVSGHSNGGQGTWFFLTHQPDKVVAAAPVSGYSSIENYVPFTMWHNAEPALTAVLKTARQSFKHELLVSNIAGIPVLQQHGSADDNVPAYHSRLMHELIYEAGLSSEYHELEGKGHWFDGVLTTDSLLSFYSRHAAISNSANKLLPLNFSIVVPASGDMGSKGGIVVDQLETPDRSGHIKVSREDGERVWRLSTGNIHRFHLSPAAIRATIPSHIFIDNGTRSFAVPTENAGLMWFVKTSGEWIATRGDSWRSLDQRYGKQLGMMDAILRTTASFTVRAYSQGSDGVASQISRNTFQYFAADSRVISRCKEESFARASDDHNTGNVITVALKDDLPRSELANFPIHVDSGNLVVRRPHLSRGGSSEHKYEFEPGLGAIFLRPLMNDRLELVVWGADLSGLQQASRLVPMLTGVGQPDFVVLSDRCRWQGFAGVYAAGFFDRSWQVSGAPYVT